MRLDGEETFFGESIDTSEEFIEDFCERVNNVYNTAMDEAVILFNRISNCS